VSTAHALPMARCRGCGLEYRPGRGCPKCRNARRPPRPRDERARPGTFRCHKCRTPKPHAEYAPTPGGSHRAVCLACERDRDEALARAEAAELAAAKAESARLAEALARLKPTTARPGTPEKVDVLCERAELGAPLFHPDDPAWPDRWNDIVKYVRLMTPMSEAG